MLGIDKWLKLLRPIIPYLPKFAQRLMPGVLAFLPLVFQIASLLYKHREKISEILRDLSERVSTESRKKTDGLLETIPHLPRGRARWLKRRLEYLPLAFEIAKASKRNNMKRLRNLTAPFPGTVKRKVHRILQRERRPSRRDFFQRFRR